MNEEELKKQVLQKLAGSSTTQEIREAVKKAAETLDESNLTKAEQQRFFRDVLKKAQDNTATMDNAGKAQEIINSILDKK